jgi:Haem-binding domain
MTLPRISFSLAALICMFFGAVQFIRPTMKDPPHEALLQGAAVPAEVNEILERACQDCHSNNTNWPWYAKVTPISFMVAQDVNRGRRFLNLSEWQKYSDGQKLGYLGSMADAARDRKMPPIVYSTMHPDARLADSERRLIAAWASEERKRVRPN